jgi:transposase
MAAHYGTAILAARPRKPRDKAKVEQAVLIVERWLLGQLAVTLISSKPHFSPERPAMVQAAAGAFSN